jgi:hypothetical protein
MKHFLLSVAAMFVLLTAYAGPVDFATAKKLAESVINNGDMPVEKTVEEVVLSAEVNSRMSVSPVEAPAFYVFEAEEGGFAIVSGEDAFPEVIGYSTDGQISRNGSMPDALVAYLESYSRYVEDVRKGLVDAPVTDRVFSVGTPVVAPMCVTKWGQGSPYNNLCPMVNMRHTPVGCVATAMAQVMYYHKYPERAKGYISYYTGNTSIGNISMDFYSDSHIYHWDEMKATSAEMSDSASRASVARLSYDCGVATKMQYSPNGSGTTDAECALAFRENFGYSKSSVKYIMREWFSSQKEWNRIVFDELDEGRPLIYCGNSLKGSGRDAAGHAFIFDGYDSEGNVHVNWGWDGASDGYYNIVTLDMGTYAFSERQSMVFGIKPGTEEETAVQSRLLVFHNSPRASVVSTSLDKRIMMDLQEFYNYDAEPHSWKCGIGLFDKHGRFLECVGKEVSYVSWNALSGWASGPSVFVKIPSKLSNGETLPEGDYALRYIINEKGFTLEDGSEDWILPYSIGGDKANWLPVEIKGKKAYLDQVSSGIGDVEIDGVAVLSSEFFDLNGRNVVTPSDGQIVVEKQRLTNGKFRSVKRRF